MNRRPTLLSAALVLMLCLGAELPSAWAIENPVEKTGFHPTSIYENFGNENIDMLNGNLNLVFPFIPAIPAAGGRVDMGMSAVYNSRVWQAITGFSWLGGWPDPQGDVELSQFFAQDPSGELGLGWTMSLGFLRDEETTGKYIGLVYYGADGSKHSLYQMGQSNELQATDGSFLRASFTRESGNLPNTWRVTSWTIKFPNGVKHELGHHVQLGFPYRAYSLNGWYPTRIVDPYGNAIEVEYDPVYPRLIKRLRTTVPSGVAAIPDAIRQIEFTSRQLADTEDVVPRTLVWSEDFESIPWGTLQVYANPVTWPDRWSSRRNDLGAGPCLGEWVHVHGPGEPQNLGDFRDCAGDNGDPAHPNRSLYFGRDHDGRTGVECSYDYLDCSTPATRYTDDVEVRAVTPVIPALGNPAGLPADAYLSFRFKRDVRPPGEFPINSGGNVNWDTDAFEVWVETVKPDGTFVGEQRLVRFTNVYSTGAGWIDSGGIDLSSFVGKHIRVRFNFNTEDLVSPVSLLDRDHTGIFVDDIRIETGGAAGGEPGGLYDDATVTLAGGQSYKIDFRYKKKTITHPLAKLRTRTGAPTPITMDAMLLSEVRIAETALGNVGLNGGPIKVTFGYNEWGELNRVVYPTGGINRYEYGEFPSVGSAALPPEIDQALEVTYNPIGLVYPMSPSNFSPSTIPIDTMHDTVSLTPYVNAPKTVVTPNLTLFKDPYKRWYFELTHRGVTAKSVTSAESGTASYWTYERDTDSAFALGGPNGAQVRANPRYCVVRYSEDQAVSEGTESALAPSGGTLLRSRVYHYLAPIDDLSLSTDDTSRSGLIRRVDYYSGNVQRDTTANAFTADPDYPNQLVKFNSMTPGVLLRSEVTKYEQDDRNLEFYDEHNVRRSEIQKANQYVTLSDTTFHDDLVNLVPRQTRTEGLGRDDYGHLATQAFYDNFDGDAPLDLRKVSYTKWNANATAWILDQYDYKYDMVTLRDYLTWSELQRYAYSEYRFNAQGDILEQVQRGSETLTPANFVPDAGTSLSIGDTDTKVSYTYTTTQGLRDLETYEAKEAGQPVSTAWVKNEYLFGVPKRRYFLSSLSPETSLAWNVFDRPSVGGQPGIEGETGRVRNESGPQGIVTRFDYDVLGRMASITPPAPERATSISYPNPKRTIAVRGTPSSPSDVGATQVEYGFDGFGRKVSERRLMPDGTYAKQTERFDGLGRKVFTSEWVADGVTNPPGTTWGGFDDWDRPAFVRYADHTSDVITNPGYRQTTYAYYGTRRVDVTQAVGTSPGVQTPATTAQIYDGLGRLTTVIPPAGPVADYFYEVGDKLTWAVQDRLRWNPSLNGGAGGWENNPNAQIRTFHYDRTGRLRWEEHPELGRPANGSTPAITGRVTYRNYDAFGNPRVKVDTRGANASTVYELQSSFDAAGRPLEVRKWITGGTTFPLARYTYDEVSRGVSAGMLTTVESFYTSNNDTAVYPLSTRRHYYNGLNGRLSVEGTIFHNWIGSSAGPELQTTYLYNDYGQVRQITYPKGPLEPRLQTIVDQSYSHGLPYALESPTRGMLVTETRYNPAGGVSLLAYGNAVNNWIGADVRNRPLSFQFRRTDLTTLFAFGNYQYDGSGNIVAIGNDTYRYDLLSRLTEATLNGNIPSPHTFAYTFDAWGNITSKRLDVGVSPNPLLTPLRQMFEMPSYDLSPSPALRSYAGNRITGDTAFDYDLNGNLTKDLGATNTWDALNRLKYRAGNGQYYFEYRYDADNRRVWEGDAIFSKRQVFYLRNSQGQVLTEYGRPAENTLEPRWSKDYIYQGDRAITLVENVDPKGLTGAYSEVIGGNVARFHWDPTTDDDHYQYRLYGSASANGGRVVWQTTAAETTMDRTLPSANYYWLADIDTAGNESPHSVAFYIQPNDSTPPPAVQSMSGVQDGFTPLAVRVNWAELTGPAAADVQGYDVYRKAPGASVYEGPVNGLAPIRDITYRDIVTATGTGLYQYKVVARDTTGNRSTTWPEILVTVNSNGGCVPGQMCDDPPEAWAPMIPPPDDLGRVAMGCSMGTGGWTSGAETSAPVCEGSEVGIPSGLRVIGSSENPGWRLVFLHADHLGSVRMTSYLDGSVASYHTYEPFGWEVPQSYASSNNTHRFTGHERDEKTGLDYMLARYFASNQGRFLSVDPARDSVNLTDPQSWNRYAYSANNPVRYVDPDGMHTADPHREMTEEALRDRMSPEALGEVVTANVGVDDEPGAMGEAAADTNKHSLAGVQADGTFQTPMEAAAGSQEFVDGRVAAAAASALDGNFGGARREFGRAVHTAQDATSEAHENFAEWHEMDSAGTITAGALHGMSDAWATPTERAQGVANTVYVHGAVEQAIRSEGAKRQLSDAAITTAIAGFNGRQ